MLVWLQIFAAAMSLTAMWRPEAWMHPACEQLDRFNFGTNLGEVGICACRSAPESDQHDCYAEQLVFRVQASAAAVFLVLALMSLSGCVSCAAKTYVVFKFFAVFAAAVVLLFVPNTAMEVCGVLAGAIGAAFFIPQAVMVIDAAYTWNERWFHKVVESGRDLVNGERRAQYWQSAIVVSALLLIVAGVALAISFCNMFPSKVTNALVIPTVVVSAILLVLSITSWCEHGSLLTSAAFFLYSVWLAWEALVVFPDFDAAVKRPIGPYGDLVICIITLLAFAVRGGLSIGSSETSSASESHMEAGSSDSTEGDSTEQQTKVSATMFAGQNLVHAVAAVYICSALAPRASVTAFIVRVAAISFAEVMYGWTLIAPKACPSRSFNRV